MINKRVKNIVYGFFFEVEKDLGYKYSLNEQSKFSDSVKAIVNRNKKGKFDGGFIIYREAISTGEAMELLNELKENMKKTGCRFSIEFMQKFIEEIENDSFFDSLKIKKGKMRGLKIGKEVEYENFLFGRDKKLKEMDSARGLFVGSYKEVAKKKMPRSFVNTSFERGCFNKVVSVQDEFEKGMRAQERRLNGGKLVSKKKKVSVNSLSKKQELEIEKTGKMIGKFF